METNTENTVTLPDPEVDVIAQLAAARSVMSFYRNFHFQTLIYLDQTSS